jgi:protein gp37
MSEQTSIQWCGATWNPWQGCIKISQGCKNCYMYRDKERYGQDPRDVHRSSPATFNAPLRWQREVEQGRRRGQGRLIFTCSWSDWFIAEADAWRDEAWEIVRRCPNLIFQILTKRPERIADHLPPDWGDGYSNVWLGVSCEDQANAEHRVPVLLAVPAAVRFLSCEPLLSEIDLTRLSQSSGDVINGLYGWHEFGSMRRVYGVDWIICGGESGYATGKYAARPCHVNWIRSIVAQCRAAGVSCHVKQLGSWPRCDRDESERYLRDKHGGDPSEWPEDLRVREFPIVLEDA